MRVLVVGAGAVGTYLAALLRGHERDVSIVARGARAAALRADGLRLRGSQTLTVSLPIFDTIADAATASPFDLVIVAVKSTSLTAAAEELGAVASRLFAREGLVLCVQNQLDAEDVVAARVAGAHVLGGVVHAGLEALPTGEVVLTSGGEVHVGPRSAEDEPRAVAVSELLAASGIPGGFQANLARLRWRKMIWNASFNPVTALATVTVDTVVAHTGTRSLVETLMREAMAVATATGFRFHESVLHTFLTHAADAAGQKTSMLQDVLAGRPTEHQTISGPIAALGRAHGIPTPATDIVLALLDARAQSLGRG